MGRHGSSECPRRKLVVVGDGACGKTSLLLAFTKNQFDESYTPTIFETALAMVEIRPGKCVQMSLWDTAGQEAYARLRPLSYSNTDVVLICFDMHRWDSFYNVRDAWLPEIRQYCRRASFFVVGCKADLVTDGSVTLDDVERMAEKIGAHGHFVCSARTRQGVADVFSAAGRVACDRKFFRRTRQTGCFGRRRRASSSRICFD